MQKLRVGIAGQGILGRRRRSFIERHPDLELVAVCDRLYQSRQTHSKGVRYLQDYQDLLDLDLQCVFVCLTNDISAAVTAAAISRDMHVFCEKPPGQTVEDIRKVMLVESEHPRIKLQYGFNHRHHRSVRQAFNIIKNGSMGQLINIRGVYGKSRANTFGQPDWRTRRAVAGGGILLDQGIHMVDLMRVMAGPFNEVHSFISNGFWHHDVEDNAYAIMRAKSGVIAMLHSSSTQWQHKFCMDIAMERGTITLDGIITASGSYGDETITVTTKEDDHGHVKQTKQLFTQDICWDQEIDAFVRSVRHDLAVTDGSSHDALETMRLIYKIYHADPIWRDRYNIKDPNA